MADQPNTKQLIPYATEYTYEASHKDTEFGQQMLEAMCNWTGFIAEMPTDTTETEVKTAFKDKEHILIQIVKQAVDHSVIRDAISGQSPLLFRLNDIRPSDLRENTFNLTGDILDFENPASKFVSLTINNPQEVIGLTYTPDVTAKADGVNYKIISIIKWTAKSFEADAITI